MKSKSKPSSLSSISDLISIDRPLAISPSTVDELSSDNRDQSVCNEDLYNSVSFIDLNLNYVSPIKSNVRSSFDLLNILDLSEQSSTNHTFIEVNDCSKPVCKTKSSNSIKSLGILQENFTAITPSITKMSLDGSSYIPISVNLSVNDNCNTVVISHPFTIQNSPEFWDSTIRSADEVEAQIRITKKHNYEDLFAVVRCIDFSPNIPMPQPITMISSPYKINFFIEYKFHFNILLFTIIFCTY